MKENRPIKNTLKITENLSISPGEGGGEVYPTLHLIIPKKSFLMKKEAILEKIDANLEIVGIVGLGYVGLPLAVSFADSGITTIGFDKDTERVSKINNGGNYIMDIRDAVLKDVVINKKFLSATSDFSLLNKCDAILICVPTPLNKFREPDMSYIKDACTEIGRNMKPATFICLESTTYPTTTEEFVLPVLEKESGLKAGKDFWLAYSPERVDPANKGFHTRNTPKVIGGLDDDSLEIGLKVYQKAIDHLHPVSSPRIAEMVKILENTYRLVNISLINELALLSGKMDINIWEVIEAAKTKPFGFQAFYPGPGIGGHCIPLDPFYLEYIAKQFNFDLSMIHTAGHINMRMPHYMYIKITTALNSHKKAVNGSRILFLGIAYKPNINDDRESPALKIIDIVAHKGADIYYHDPYISQTQTPEGREYHSVPLTEEELKNTDCVVLTTAHKGFDTEFIQQHARLIVDLKNMIQGDINECLFKL